VFGVFVELEALFVDDDLMVEPAERNQVFGIGFSALGPGGFVVDFDPVTAVTPVSPTEPMVSRQEMSWFLPTFLTGSICTNSHPFSPKAFNSGIIACGAYFGGCQLGHRFLRYCLVSSSVAFAHRKPVQYSHCSMSKFSP
jgi:hypothetical protein